MLYVVCTPSTYRSRHISKHMKKVTVKVKARRKNRERGGKSTTGRVEWNGMGWDEAQSDPLALLFSPLLPLLLSSLSLSFASLMFSEGVDKVLASCNL